MAFKGRSVLVFILLGMFASSLITIVVIGSPIMAEKNEQAAAVLDTKGLSTKQINKIAAAYDLIEKNFYTSVEANTLIDGAINGMLNSLEDPYSAYMGVSEAQAYTESIDGSFEGIGAEVVLEGGKVMVMSPIKGSPAERAGIQAKDIIVSVNGESLTGLPLNEAITKIRGPKGTKAKLEIVRGSSKPIEIIVVRDQINLETVYAEMLANKVGKIEITQFAQNTGERFAEELSKLEEKGMKGLIIDVRNNPGGFLPVVLHITEPFIPKGKSIVQVENRDKQREKEVSKGTGKTYPVAVLINKGSASASEILAGAIQDTGVGKLIGETTFGKGTVQSNFQQELGDGSIAKITIAKWLTPNGTWIHKTGIKPDMAVAQPFYFSVSPLSKKSTLTINSTGDDVKNAQLMLKGLGYAVDRTDGYFSNATTSAVKAFQKAVKVTVTGSIDKETATKLETAIIELIRNPEKDVQLKQAVSYMNQQLSVK